MSYNDTKRGMGGTLREQILTEIIASVNKTGRAINNLTSQASMNKYKTGTTINFEGFRLYNNGSIMANSSSSAAGE